MEQYGREYTNKNRKTNEIIIPPSNPYITPINFNPTPMGTAPNVQSGVSSGGGDDKGEGWWKAPSTNITSPPGHEWAKRQYSPQMLAGINKMYGMVGTEIPELLGRWKANKPQSLADMYGGFLEKNPALEQIEYNQALARLKGQKTATVGGLNRALSARRGGAEGGGYIGSLADIERMYGRGVQDIATNQAVRNMMEREARQKNLIGYAGQDIANTGGWLGGLTGAMQSGLGTMGGWIGQQTPFEQWNIQTPRTWAENQARLNLQGSTAEEQINAARREETMGWLDRLTGFQGQQGGQYYAGQGQWGDYQGNRGRNILAGYGM